MARNIHELALRARGRFGKPEEDLGGYLYAVEEAWRQFVQDAGGFYRQVLETDLVIGQREYALPTDVRDIIEVRVQSSTASVVLTLKTRADLAPLPESEATAGTPASYYMPDRFTVALEPVSDNETYDELRVEYWGDAPDSLDVNDSDGLPCSGFVEKGLIGYAAFRIAGYADGMKDYEETLVRWRRGESRVRQVNRTA